MKGSFTVWLLLKNQHRKGGYYALCKYQDNEGRCNSQAKGADHKGVTQLLVDVLDKNPQTTFVVIDEVETDNWGIGGESVTMRRKRGQ